MNGQNTFSGEEGRYSRRAFLRLAALTVAGATVAACVPASPGASTAGGAPSTGPVEVSFQHFFDSPELKQTFDPIFASIEKETNTKIRNLPTPYGEMLTKLLTMTAGGTPPDITSAASDWVKDASGRGIFMALDDRLALLSFPMSDFMPSRLQDGSFNGVNYSVPIDQGSTGMYYNKDIFDEAGIEYPTKDWSWDKLREVAIQLTKDTNGKTPQDAGFDPENIDRYGLQGVTTLHRAHSVISSLCGDPKWYDDEVTQVTMDKPDMLAAWQWYMDLRTVDHCTPTPEQALGFSDAAGGIFPFGLGKYAMEITWIGMISALKLDGVTIKNWDVAPLPAGKGTYATSSGQHFAVLKDSKVPDPAWSVIASFLSEEHMKMLGTVGAWTPARISMAKYGQPLDGVPSRFMEGMIDPVSCCGFSFYWYLPGYPEWSREIQTALEPAWRGEISAEEAMASFKPKVSEMVTNRPRPGS
jgi:multiple sugar transport system substrate-binding protein